MQKQMGESVHLSAAPGMIKKKKNQIFLSHMLLSGPSINAQHCIMPVCILFNHTQREDAERFLLRDNEKKPGISVEIIQQGNFPH